MRVFLSSHAIDSENAQALVRAIRAADIEVEHSPRNPIDGHGPIWSDWYSSGLPNAVGKCDLFIVVVDRGWDSSTWMGIEAEAWRTRWAGLMPRAYFWNPESITVSNGMACYLKEVLPRELGMAVKQIAAQQNLL